MTEVPHRSIDWGKVFSTAALLPLGMALVAGAIAPASAQSTIIIDGGYYPNGGYNVPDREYYPPTNQQPQAAPFVYGSPIPTPVPVDPSTGLTPRNRNNNTYSYPVHSDPYRDRVQDSTIINPVLVNPRIKDSTIVNPVIIDDSRSGVPQGGYYRRSGGGGMRSR